eukprot:s6715_g4.t1
MSAELLLRCKKGHAVKELKESDKRWNPFLHTVCSVCGGSIASQTARWSCEHHCSTVCDACVVQQFQMLLVELQQSSLHVAHNGGPAVVKEVEAIPWELRGTKEFNQLRKLLQQDSKPFPHAFGIVLEGAVNVPELCRRRRSTGPRASATILAPAAAAGAFFGGPGAVVGLAVGATAYGVSRGAMQAKYPDGFCDPVVLVEVLDKDGETLAAARSHIATKTRNPVWHQTLSLPCARDMQLAQQQGCSWRKHRKSVKLAAAQNVLPDQWDVASTTVRVTLYDKSVGPMDQTIGEVAIPLTQLLEDSQATYLVSDAWHEAVLGTQQPHLPCKVSLSVVQESLPKTWSVAQAKNDPGQRYPMHVFMMTRGTRGDVQPFVALARGLAERLGWLVTICTEQSHAAFVRKHSDVHSGKIRFRPSGGNTEARMDSVGAHFLLTHRAEFLQMIALSRSEADFFSSATVFVDYVKAMEAEPNPVDLVMFGFTLAGVAALVGEHCQKPVVGFILQPSCIPSKDEDWKAVQPIHSPDGKSLLDTVDEMAFTSHNSLKLLKDLAEKNPFASLNLNHLRQLFGLGPTDTWQAYNQARVPIIIPMPAGTFQRPQDWTDNIIQTDFIFLRNQAGAGRKSLGEVGDFVEAARQEGKKLCLITFSSMRVPRRTLLRIIVKMLSEANFPVAVIYVGRIDEGPEELENAARQFKETGRFFEARAVDFGLLFPEMDCFVVHGGLGTTVEALRTRKPCCVTGPLLMDQRFWGYVCHEKGVGPKPVFIADFEKHCVDFVNNAVNPEDPEHWQANARDSDWGKVQDDGVQANVDCIQGLLSELEPLVTRSEVQDDSWMMQKSWLMHPQDRHAGVPPACAQAPRALQAQRLYALQLSCSATTLCIFRAASSHWRYQITHARPRSQHDLSLVVRAMASRLSCRRSTIGPRHSLLLRPAEEVPTELRGLPEELSRRIATATSESELRDVAGEVVEEALLLLDHRGLIKDLDKIWPTTRACKQLGTSEVLTLTSAIKMSLASTLRDTAQRGVMPRRKVLALFNFLAELCWANYMCPSEHAIQKAMHCLLDTAWALTECAGNSEPAGWYVESCAYFLARVGEIIMLNPLEVFNVLDPLSARLASLARQLPRRTKSFVWLLLRRREMMW